MLTQAGSVATSETARAKAVAFARAAVSAMGGHSGRGDMFRTPALPLAAR